MINELDGVDNIHAHIKRDDHVPQQYDIYISQKKTHIRIEP